MQHSAITSGDDKPRVLVIDDNPEALNVVKRLVENVGLEVECEKSGRAALHRLLDGSYQMVIAEWHMPDVSGLEVCQAIRDLESLPFVYVILTTELKPTDERIEEAFNAGIDDFLAKPVRRADLVARLYSGCRMIAAQKEVQRRQREIHRFGAEMQVANSKLATAQEQLRILATTDELTGLGNRRAAMTYLQSHWAVAARHNSPISCIMIDIDHFKLFNDQYGHDVGDQVLAVTAEGLRLSARDSDPVFRMGGEEFLVLCPQATEVDAAVAAERFRREIEAIIVSAQDQGLRITISLGVAQREPGMKKPDELLKAADQALYAAKRTGRNRACKASEFLHFVDPVTASTTID